MRVSRIPQWLNAICKDCENYLEIKGEKTPRAGSLMTQMLYEAGGDPSEVSQCVHNFLKRYLGFNREWCIYYEKREKFYEENGCGFDKTLDNYMRKLFAWDSKLKNYAEKLAWHFLPPRMRRGWYYRLPRPTRRPKNRPLSEHEILAEEWARKRSYEYGRAIFRGLRIKGAPQPAPQRADMSPTPRPGM